MRVAAKNPCPPHPPRRQRLRRIGFGARRLSGLVSGPVCQAVRRTLVVRSADVGDVIIGPTLSLVVAAPNKLASEFRRDLLIIIALQVGAFSYGIYSIALARPVVIAFEVDRFRVVSAAKIDRTRWPRLLPDCANCRGPDRDCLQRCRLRIRAKENGPSTWVSRASTCPSSPGTGVSTNRMPLSPGLVPERFVIWSRAIRTGRRTLRLLPTRPAPRSTSSASCPSFRAMPAGLPCCAGPKPKSSPTCRSTAFSELARQSAPPSTSSKVSRYTSY